MPPDQRFVKKLSAQNSLSKLCTVQILFRSIEDAVMEAS